jgi:hypothetical protein
MPSYTGPNPVLTRWASTLLGHRRAATVRDATPNERVRTDGRTWTTPGIVRVTSVRL